MSGKVIQRIDSFLKLINRALEKIKGVSLDDFINNRNLQDSVSFSILQIGERMNKLEELLHDKYPDLPWKEARDMRNIIVHDYEGVDFKKVYLTATNDLPILKTKFLQIKDDICHISENSLKTDRLILRPWNDFDAQELYELAKEPEIGFWCGWEPHKRISDTYFALHNFLEVKETYAITLKEDNTIVGCISLMFKDKEETDECELGYWIGKSFWNNGYVTEAAKEIIRHGFEDLKVTKIWCGYHESNERSKRVQEKLGFVFDHTYEYNEKSNPDIKKTGYMNLLTKERFMKS